MPIFTAFCREAGNTGTTWISTVDAHNDTAAIPLAREACAADWGYAFPGTPEYDEACGNAEEILVIGIIEGNVTVLYWDDDGLTVPE